MLFPAVSSVSWVLPLMTLHLHELTNKLNLYQSINKELESVLASDSVDSSLLSSSMWTRFRGVLFLVAVLLCSFVVGALLEPMVALCSALLPVWAGTFSLACSAASVIIRESLTSPLSPGLSLLVAGESSATCVFFDQGSRISWPVKRVTETTIE